MKNVKLLGRAELKKIVGGLIEPAGGKCKIKYYGPGSETPIWYNISTSGTCAHQQIEANAACVSILQSQNLEGDRCFYDCACDDPA